MSKRVLVPNGNYTDIRLIKALKEMGFYVITSGNAPDLAGHKYADEYVGHDYSDFQGMLEIAKGLNLDYVSACSNDFGVTTAAYIAENLGFPGHDTFMNARIIAEKDLFKKFAQENNLQVIPSHHFDDEQTAVEFAISAEYPIIVKPNDLGGGKGVSRADTFEEAKTAIAKAFELSRSKHIVIEPYIDGSQHSITAFLVDHKVKVYSSQNEYPCLDNPFLVGYHSNPADSIEKDGPILVDQIEKMAALLGLVDGIFHVQYRRFHDKPYIMECMRRNLGNFALKSESEAIGFEWEKAIERAYCGMPVDDMLSGVHKDYYQIHYYVQAPRNGVIKEVRIADELKPYLYDSIVELKPGMTVERYNVEMLGFLFFRFPDEQTYHYYCKSMYQYVTVEMENN